MKYYDEEKMVEVRNIFDREVLKWKGVTSKPMMGCLCYFYNRKFIGFLVTDGIVLMKLLKEAKDVRSVMPFVRKRYEEVSAAPHKK